MIKKKKRGFLAHNSVSSEAWHGNLFASGEGLVADGITLVEAAYIQKGVSTGAKFPVTAHFLWVESPCFH